MPACRGAQAIARMAGQQRRVASGLLPARDIRASRCRRPLPGCAGAALSEPAGGKNRAKGLVFTAQPAYSAPTLKYRVETFLTFLRLFS